MTYPPATAADELKWNATDGDIDARHYWLGENTMRGWSPSAIAVKVAREFAAALAKHDVALRIGMDVLAKEQST